MINNKPNHKEQNTKVIAFLLILASLFIIHNSVAEAQTLGLSITPPIAEVMIIPGKIVTQTFTITNDGNDGMASIYIIPFKAQGESGNVALDEKNAVTATSPYASWFSIISPVSVFGEKFYMAGGQRQEITVKITPPESATEKDYYFTLLYELDNNIPGGTLPMGPTNQARIGANLILSLSRDGNPPKTAEIVGFKAPKIIDSLEKLTFDIRIGNFGSHVFKPDGEITIKPIFGSVETLNLAPLNIISDSVRNIPCLKGEEIIVCQSNRKVLVGVYKSTLEITPNGSGETQSKTVTTVAFPFSIIFGLLLIFITYRIIKKSQKVGKESS